MDLEERVALRKLASLPYWWEKTRVLDMPQPKTVYVPYEGHTLRRSLDGEKLDITPLLKAADTVGGYPVFLRTDQMAGKHFWDRTCYVESADVMYRHVMRLLEDNCMADMAGEVLPSGLAVREYLDLDWTFKAFHGNMPIATEVRTFLRDGIVECIHPYWPPKAIADWAEPPQVDWSEYGIAEVDVPKGMLSSPGRPKPNIPDGWRDILAKQNARSTTDIDMIRAQALKVAAVMDGWWSCDMALGKDGIWYLIDMAPGAASYHWPTCKYAPTG